eukprot:304133_1
MAKVAKLKTMLQQWLSLIYILLPYHTNSTIKYTSLNPSTSSQNGATITLLKNTTTINDTTIEPTYNPTMEPTIEPTYNPTIEPTLLPTLLPSESPVIITTDKQLCIDCENITNNI